MSDNGTKKLTSVMHILQHTQIIIITNYNIDHYIPTYEDMCISAHYNTHSYNIIYKLCQPWYYVLRWTACK